VHDTGRDAIKITPKSNNATIRRCEIYNSGRIYPPGTPLEDRNAEGIDNVQGSGMKVQDSHVHDTSTNGIYFKGGASDVVIERNRVERTGEAGILVGFDTSPEFFDLAQNPQYYEAVRGVVRNNIVRDTDYAGIGLYASRDAVVANNTLINTARVGHGALYFGVTLQDFDPIAGRPANVSPRILNNLVQQTTSRGPCVSIRFANELGGLSGLSGASGIDYSLFGSSTGCRFFDQRPGSVLDEGGSFAQWRQAALADAHSSEGAVALTADGHLTAGASAIGAGTTLTEVADDFDHQARTAPVDIGADEFATAGGVSADEPAFSAIALPLPAPAFPNCPGGYFVATIDDGPAPGLSPGIFGFDLTLNAPGTQRLEGGLNFGGSLDGSQVAFAGFNIQNTANEPQGLDLRLNGNPASSQDGTLPVRIKVFRQASAGVNELVFEAAASLSIAQAYTAALTLNPGFHVVTVAPEGAASVPGGSADGQVYVSLGSQFVGRPGGGFFGGVVVGGYHAAPPFGDNSGFASFCLGSAHAATAHVLSAPTYGATGAHDLRLRILDHLRREVIVVP
jgi:parallel beta-helix repeat protein